eukprot:2704772-Pyramimonas_sp.AAC.1
MQPLQTERGHGPAPTRDVRGERRRRARDIFPLPCPRDREVFDRDVDRGLPRGLRQRLGERLSVHHDVLNAVDSLNWLHDPSVRCGRDRHASYVGPSLAQCQCLNHIEASVQELGPPPASLSPAEALLQLRVAGGAYTVEQ